MASQWLQRPAPSAVHEPSLNAAGIYIYIFTVTLHLAVFCVLDEFRPPFNYKIQTDKHIFFAWNLAACRSYVNVNHEEIVRKESDANNASLTQEVI
jgi:hypothetical protein